MRLLALDTAGDACSCALLADGILTEDHRLAPRRQAEIVLDVIDGLLGRAGLAAADLDAVAFGRGPGSFTGVRIAAAVAQGLAFAAGKPLVPVSSLAALAQGAVRERGATRVLAAFDARMGELYWGAFEVAGDGLVQAVGPEQVRAPDGVDVPAGTWTGAGPGWEAHGKALRARIGASLDAVHPTLLPRAADLARLGARDLRDGRAVPCEEAVPVYLRDRVAVPRRRDPS